jgi:beta-1,4-mannosyltransferase
MADTFRALRKSNISRTTPRRTLSSLTTTTTASPATRPSSLSTTTPPSSSSSLPLRTTVCVVVLGDVGRSPRMQYHCASLASLPNTDVALVGLRGERCFADVENHPNITQHLLDIPFSKAPRAFWALTAPLKVAYQICALFYTLLCVVRRPRAFLVQNPPAIPTLAVVLCVARLRRARVIVDWHNFGFSILALSLGPKHPLVYCSEVYERVLSRAADANLCVTAAMRQWLAAHWRVRATVLYDRPPAAFEPTPLIARHALWTRLAPFLPHVDHFVRSHGGSIDSKRSPSPRVLTAATTTTATAAAAGVGNVSPSDRKIKSSIATSLGGRRTIQTEMSSPADGGLVKLLPARPAIIVSSTSWTADEDFNMFIDALLLLDAAASTKGPRGEALPNFLALVTGKGPLRGAFEARVASLPWRRVTIRTLWLEQGDYPLLLGSADAGVSLHASSSGLDLPMKVVDMHGAGLPVLALNFAALPELVRHEDNGLVFKNAQQLAEQLEGLFTGFPLDDPSKSRISRFRARVAESSDLRWSENWNTFAAPLFN